MDQPDFDSLTAEISTLSAVRTVGRICAVEGNTLRVSGLGHAARMGDQLQVYRRGGEVLGGEVLQLAQDSVVMLPDAAPDGVSLGDRVALLDANTIAPSDAWIGRIIDPYGKPLDGAPLMRGARARALRADPPAAATRRAMGERLETGMAVFNTLLPVVRGQRVGLFAGSGVGKSSLLAHLARNMQADVVVIALVGERGRELRDFVENVLGEDGMRRSVVIAATSDRSPLVRRRCAWTAMSVAEHFRDQGKHVLFLADSITRFAEAHREVAVASGEAPSLRGYPPSTAHTIMSLCERAGPGAGSSGDITAVLSVLVAGSDMEEPIADILRGVLDGHVVLDRKIAERGRYPAVDLLRSVSRSLPDAASPEENASLTEARQLLGAYAQSEMMIRAGLYSEGSDPMLDSAIKVQSDLDAFLAEKESQDSSHSFSRLQLILRRAQSAGRSAGQKRSNVPNRAAPPAPAPRQRASGGALTVNPAVRGASGGQLPAE